MSALFAQLPLLLGLTAMTQTQLLHANLDFI